MFDQIKSVSMTWGVFLQGQAKEQDSDGFAACTLPKGSRLWVWIEQGKED
jgi:hypothetical protein